MKNLSDEQLKEIFKNSFDQIKQDELFVQNTIKRLPKESDFCLNIGFHIFLSICITVICVFFSKSIFDLMYGFIEKKISLELIFTGATYALIIMFLVGLMIKKLNTTEP